MVLPFSGRERAFATLCSESRKGFQSSKLAPHCQASILLTPHPLLCKRDKTLGRP